MSLFRMREVWTHQVGSGEEYDRGCVAVGNVDGGTIDEEAKKPPVEKGQQDKIATGSLDGMLRLFRPNKANYNPSDLLLEQKLDAPVLQLAIGRFSSASATMELAVLHPRALAVYRVLSSYHAETNEVEQCQLELKYTHPLGEDGQHFTACNMVHGTFGHENTRMHSICVQSMDCQLAFFTGAIASFSRFLPSGLVPGPLCYIHSADIFVTCSPDMKIQAFKFQTIAAAKKEKNTGAADGKGGSSSIKWEWECNIGEFALQIISSRIRRDVSPSPTDVVVIGEHSLFFIDHKTGEMLMQRRLEFKSTAMCSYPAGDLPNSDCDNIIVASNTGHVMVYDNLKLIWASNVPVNTTGIVVHVQVSEFFNTKGLITIVDDEGQAAVVCLGTRPTPVQLRDDDQPLDYDAVDEEHHKLLATIRQAQATEGPGNGEGSSSAAFGKLLLRAKCPPHLEEEDAMDEYERGNFQFVRTSRGVKMLLKVRVYVLYKCSEPATAAPLKSVNLSVSAPNGLVCRDTSFSIESLAGTTEANATVIPVYVYPAADIFPAELNLQVVAAYTLPNGEPRTATHTVALPLSSVCRVMPAVKFNSFKFTLEVNRRDPPRLTQLYKDMVADPQVSDKAREKVLGQTSNVISFCYHSGVDCTILGSKSGGRFRVQSSCLETMLLVTADFVSRLAVHFGSSDTGGAEPFRASYSDPLPLADFFEAAEAHFQARKRLIAAVEDLDNRAHQFRSVQKRLLVRYKDRNSAPLDHLDTLLAGTFDKIQDASERVDESRQKLGEVSQGLSVITGLTVLLMRHRYSLDDDNFQTLQCALSTHIGDSDTGGQGWEERTDAAVTHLLRTTLAKTVKDTTVASTDLSLPKNLKKFKKHITILCDRLGKGALPAAPQEAGGQGK
eukprot:INCI19307.2.p1 GENE.INCI19307.2~~INCI19307.2.p1  ORF type:complete len:893 (-),score=149.59 INCI19307.2:80-2758(-)